MNWHRNDRAFLLTLSFSIVLVDKGLILEKLHTYSYFTLNHGQYLLLTKFFAWYLCISRYQTSHVLATVSLAVH